MSKKVWGNATWYLFHTLAEKINEEYFLEKKKEFFDFISIICKNLPCPDCAEDATIILKNVNFNNIQSKDNLIDFFYQFHNKVNVKLKKPIFEKDDLNKYKNANTFNIIKNFLYHYFTRDYNDKMLIQSFSVNKIELHVRTFLVNLYNNGHIKQ